MVTGKDVINVIESFAPLSLAGEYDNCGLKIGNVDRAVTGVLVTVDTDLSVVREAKRKGCNFILEHHPSIFRPLRAIDEKVPLNATLLEAAKNEMVVYSAHTNVDFTTGGLNDTVAKEMGLTDISYVEDPSSARIGVLPKPCSLRKYARYLATLFDDDNVSVVGDLEKLVQKVGVINGGGGGSEDGGWETFRNGCDVFVTGDVKHNVARLAKDLDYAIIQVGHFSSERAFMPLMKEVIQNTIADMPVFCAESIGSPYNRRGEIWI